ncbi:membrane alanyl aminopeptidase-like [Aricia agestis]|uniref:membrane alanyl aminopeptidase-like n=1 Tax=Aricia agestis TaxID=91739 RepID=UPI001C20BE46|nr:membrane alanyl aminopeptidase-like [Aricia agestis]
MASLLTLVLLPALIAVVKSEFPLDVEELAVTFNNAGDEVYRLPEDLDPIHYDVEITPYFEATADKEAFTFDGVVTLTVRAVKENISSLIIQENVREILSVTLTNQAGVPLNLDPFNPFERIREYHFLKVNLREGTTLTLLEVYKLTITYIGNINETPLSRGVFRGSYKDDDGKLHWYAAIHLQPTNSRQAFPSFDEPGFKSTFDIIINRPAHFTETFSNMKIKETISNGDRVKEIFYTTPRMSAYLVTFHISEEFKVIADNGNSTNSYRVIARPNAADQGQYALEIGPPITKWLEEYLGIDYYTMGEDMKNDQIAVPDWASGATENWGLVSYRELRLLYEEGETNSQDKMYIGTIISHELAHKWFGNLITCRWWDNVWINEGFASYFEYFAIDGVDKNMELEDQFIVRYLQSALSTDSSAATRALEHTVNSPTEVTGHFSGISYSKGASLLLMLKHFVGESTFKKALNHFLVDKSYQHAFPSDLYNSFKIATEEDGVLSNDVDIYELMKYWVEEPGYPVINVNVDINDNKIHLSQERFFISASASQTEQVWPVPVTFTTGSNPNWENLTPEYVFDSRDMMINQELSNEWVIFNLQQKGIYRVNYDVNNWQLIANALKNDVSSIHHINRAQIVDDVFALMRSERMTYDLGFKVLDFLKDDTSYYSWYPAITGFSWLRNRFIHLPDTLAQFDAIIMEFLEKVIDELGYDVRTGEVFTTTLNRFYILNFACTIGHQGCIDNAIEKFNNAIQNNVKVHPDIRRHVMCQGLLNSGYEEWYQVHQQWASANNAAAKTELLRSLGCTTHSQAVQAYLQMILSDDIKSQDSINAFTYLFMGDRANAKVALEFLKENHLMIREKVVLQSWFESLLINIAAYLDGEGLSDMEQWLRTNQASVPSASVGLSGVNSARANMDWGTERASMILRAARGSASLALPGTMMLLISSVVMLLKN